MLRHVSVLVLLLLATAALSTPPACALEENILTGVQELQSVTLAADKKYTLRAGYRVPVDKELRIEAGTVINAEKDAALEIEGGLLISAADFRGAVFYGPVDGTWKGIHLVKAQRVRMEKAQIQKAEVGVYLKDTKGALLVDCFLLENGTGVMAEGTTEVRLENCSIVRNKGAGLTAAGGYVEVEWCLFASNGTYGIDGTGPCRVALWRTIVSQNDTGGIRMQKGTRFRVRGSRLENNKLPDIVNDDAVDKDFAGNWWGPALTWQLQQQGDDAEIATILDGHDEPKRGKVLVNDFLTLQPEHCGRSMTPHTDSRQPELGPHEAQIAQNARVVFLEDCYGVTNPTNFELFDAARMKGDKATVDTYMRTRIAFKIDRGALAVVLAVRGPAYGVRILDGPKRGSQGWVFKDTVACAVDLKGKQLVGKRFLWRTHGRTDGMILTLGQAGKIEGGNMTESFWKIDDNGRLVFYDRNKDVSTLFDRCELRQNLLYLSGPHKPRKGEIYYLEELTH
jgi:hypothetical protein